MQNKPDEKSMARGVKASVKCFGLESVSVFANQDSEKLSLVEIATMEFYRRASRKGRYHNGQSSQNRMSVP
jgi:hypothetical protein